MKSLVWLLLAVGLAAAADKTPYAMTGTAGGAIVIRSAAASGTDPEATARRAAEQLKAAFGQAPLKAVLVIDSFEDRARKELVLQGAGAVLGSRKLFGGAEYGGYTQAGAVDNDGVLLLGLGGEGLTVRAALAEAMGATGLTLEKHKEQLAKALGGGGERLARQLPGLDTAALLIVVADAHSPKNQLLLDGVQRVAGKKLPVTGGSVNKNAGQSWVYYRGATYTDSAVGLLLSGPLKLVQTGHQAKSNDKVIATAKEGASEALKSLRGKPSAIIAFDCAGRKGKLERLEDEVEAIQGVVGKDVPLFGCYCAGEFGPADVLDGGGDGVSCGRGWHVMFTVLGP